MLTVQKIWFPACKLQLCVVRTFGPSLLLVLSSGRAALAAHCQRLLDHTTSAHLLWNVLRKYARNASRALNQPNTRHVWICTCMHVMSFIKWELKEILTLTEKVNWKGRKPTDSYQTLKNSLKRKCDCLKCDSLRMGNLKNSYICEYHLGTYIFIKWALSKRPKTALVFETY